MQETRKDDRKRALEQYISIAGTITLFEEVV
jgi:hypothetical protein